MTDTVKRYDVEDSVPGLPAGRYVDNSDFSALQAKYDAAVGLLRRAQDDVTIRERDAAQQKESRQLWTEIDALLEGENRE